MIAITLVAALFALTLIFLVVWANPYRLSNQVFALILLVQTAWLGCVYRAMQIGASVAADKIVLLEWWFRANAAVISFLPATMWLLKSAILAGRHDKLAAVIRSVPLFSLTFFFMLLCSAPSFIYQDVAGILRRGSAYYIFCVGGVAIFSICTFDSFRLIRLSKGIRRVELQFLALNAGGASLLLLSLNALGNLFEIRALNRLSVVLVFAASAVTACALLMHRVFNAREVFSQFAQRLWFAVILCGGIYLLWRATTDLFAEPFGILFSVAVFSPFAVWLDRKTRTLFDISGEKKLAEMRQDAMSIAQQEPKTDDLIQRFESLLCARFQTQAAFFLFDQGQVHGRDNVIMTKDREGHAALCELGWATPESLDRRRPTHAMEDLKQFLETNSLGAMVPVPRGSSTPSLLVALATRPDDRPYTFPEIERIQNLAELIDSILTRSKLATQAALHARTEYLSVMSRGLAHDLKNLITPVSTFLVHTEKWFQPDTVESDVHASARGAMRAFGEYVHETLSFPDRLEPRFENLRVKDICTKVLEVSSMHARRHGVSIVTSASEYDTMMADGVLIQRMLANLVGNAIDASKPGQVVSLAACMARVGWMKFEVRDDGCGIPAEHLSRVLDPYFTTKGSGEEVRGFGLGLTIVQKIVQFHRGSIKVHSKPGQQTVITVELPNEQSAVCPSAALPG